MSTVAFDVGDEPKGDSRAVAAGVGPRRLLASFSFASANYSSKKKGTDTSALVPRFGCVSPHFLRRMKQIAIRLGEHRAHVYPPAFFLTLTMVVFHRLLPRLAACSVRPFDACVMVWNMWWLKFSLLDLHANPFLTDYIFYPQKVSLFFHALVPFYGLLSIPVQLVVDGYRGPLLSYNLATMSTFVLSGWFMYLLAYRLTSSKFASYTAGVIYSFSVYHFASADVSLNLAAMEWLPLFMYALVCYFDEGRPRHAVLAGFAFGAQLFCDYFYAMQIFLLCGIWVLYRLWQSRKTDWRDSIKRTGIIAGICALPAVCLVPFAVQSWNASLWPETPNPDSAYVNSTDIAGLVIPGSNHMLYGRLFKPVNDGYFKYPVRYVVLRTDGQRGRMVFLRYTPLLLMLAALLWWKRNRDKWMWLGIFLVFLWLSIGPVLHVYGHHIESFPSLYNVFIKMPFARMGRAPYRLMPGALVGMSVLAAFGVVGVQERFTRNRKRVELVLGLLISTTLALESAHFFTPYEIAPSAAARYLAEDPDSYAIIVASQRGVFLRQAAMFQQTTHRKRIDIGYISRFHEGLSHPLSSPPEHVLAKVKKAMQDGSFRYVLCPRPDPKRLPDRKEREDIRIIYTWLDDHVADRKDFGDEVLFRLGN